MKGNHKKLYRKLTAKILCALLGATVLGGYVAPVAWGATSTTDTAQMQGKHTTVDNANQSSAWGEDTTATGIDSTAWGVNTTASGNQSTAWGNGTTATAQEATAWGFTSHANGAFSTAFGNSSIADATNSLAALGGKTTATANNSAAIGAGAQVTVPDTVALGSGSVASRTPANAGNAYLNSNGSKTGGAWVATHNAIAVGNDATVTRQITGVAAGSADTDAVNVAQLKAAQLGGGSSGDEVSFGTNSEATGEYAVAVGSDSKATGVQSIAVGYGNQVSGNHSGAFGDPNIVTGDGSYAVGNNNTISGNNTFVMGNNVNAGNASNAVVLGNNSTAVDNAVSVGSDANKRQIKYVADGTDDSDAATMGQLRKVGSGAAALAALHPLDTEDKFGAAVGVGHYEGSTAMAAGLFYRPTDNVMLSLGGSMGNGENLVNLGVSFALGKGGTPSKKAMLRQLDALSAENAAIRAENAEIKAQNEKLEARLAAIEAMLKEK